MLQEAREEVVGSLSKLWKRNPYRSGGGVSTQRADRPPQKDQGIWDSPVGHHPPTILLSCPPHGSDNSPLPVPLQASIPSNRYALPNLLGDMARGQRAHEGAAGSEQGKDSAGVRRVASTLPSLGQAPVRHKPHARSLSGLVPGGSRTGLSPL